MAEKKTILITGANRGIGFQAAKTFAEQGHKVILTGRDTDKVAQAASQIEGKTLALKIDVTNEEDIKTAAEVLKNQGIKLNVIINNAGTVFDNWNDGTSDKPLTTSVEDLRKTLELNLIGAYAVTQHMLPLLDQSKRADIINVSSGMGGIEGMESGAPAYRISKTGMNGMTANLAAEFEGTPVHVNSICPGWVRTDLGGSNAHRSLEEGVVGLDYIVNEEPEHSGKFLRDKEVIPF